MAKEPAKYCETCQRVHGPAPKPYRSTYEDLCATCAKTIYKGEFVGWSKKIGGGQSKRHHVNCANPRVWPYNELGCRFDSPNTPKEYTPAPMPKPEHIKPEPMELHEEEEEIQDEQFDMKIPEEEQKKFEEVIQRHTVRDKPKSTGDALLDTIAQKVQEHVINDINNQVRQGIENIEKIAKEKIDQISVPSIIIKRHELPDIQINHKHKQFDEVLQLLNAHHHVYLHGAPGGHKTSLGKQLAEALGVRYYPVMLSEQSPEYRLTGFTSPVTGEWHGTPFVSFFSEPEGGLYHFCELDLANDNFRSSLNTPLDNKMLSTDKGLVFQSNKFYCLGDGNTAGNGCHPAFPSRSAFDQAFGARFRFVEFEYDWKLCRHIAIGMNKNSEPIVSWAEMVSNFALAQGIPIVIGPREVYNMADLLITTTIPTKKLFDYTIFKGLDVASKEKILTNYPIPSITR